MGCLSKTALILYLVAVPHLFGQVIAGTSNLRFKPIESANLHFSEGMSENSGVAKNQSNLRFVVPGLEGFDYVLYGGIIGSRTVQYMDTVKILSRWDREHALPQSIVYNRFVLASYEAGTVAAEIGTSVWLHKRSHKRLARTLDSLSLAAGAAVLSFNLTQPRWVNR